MGNNAAAVLKKAGISHELHWLKSEKRVFVTRANQLIGELTVNLINVKKY